MDNMNIYAETNQLLWDCRLNCYRENNEVGHSILCRVQHRLNKAISDLLQE